MLKTRSLKKQDLFEILPIFGRTTLDPVWRFSDLIGNPSDKFKSIHVTGTNGKGTVWHQIAEALQLGAKLRNLTSMKIGKYTSPHLIDFNERITINDKNIPDTDLERISTDLVEIINSQTEKLNLTSFDLITMIAFKYFEEQKVDYAVVEVGIGGSLDPTNIITPEISIITSIGYDHMQILGKTLEEISEYKAGICKPNIPAVIGPDWPIEHMMQYIKNERGLDESLIHVLEKIEAESENQNFILENSKISQKALEILRDYSKDEQYNLLEILTDDVILQACKTRPKGRLELLYNNSEIIRELGPAQVYFDVAHNQQGIAKAIETCLQELSPDSDLIVVLPFKTISSLLAVLEHKHSDRISKIILVEPSQDIDKWGYSYNNIQIKNLKKYIDTVSKYEKLSIHWSIDNKLKNIINDDFFEKLAEWQTDEENDAILKGYCSIHNTLTYLHNLEDSTNFSVLVTGTFRIYTEVIQYYINSNSI